MSSSRNNTLEFSSVGSEVLDAGDSVTGKRYGAIQVITDANFGTLSADNVDHMDRLCTLPEEHKVPSPRGRRMAFFSSEK